MANLPETENYDSGVFQLETTTPATGGAAGEANAPLRNLANRTKWLKAHVDALEADLLDYAPLLSPAFSGSPTAPTQALGDASTKIATDEFVQKTIGGRLIKDVSGSSNVTLTASEAGNGILSFTGTLTGNISVIVPASPTRSWIVKNNAAGAYSLTVKTAAGTGVVVAKWSELPIYTDGTNVLSALTEVTQGEAEAGLADTISAWTAKRVRQAINAVTALYAPLADPVLTGNPTAPTAAQFNNDASIATTAFVQRALGSYSGIKSVNVPYTLIASDAGKLIIANGNGAVTFPSGIFPAGVGVIISSSTSGDNITVLPPAGGGIFSYGGAQVASISLKDNENVSLISQGIASLIPVVNAGGLRSSPDFLFQLGVTGHFKHPSGAIYQWGTVAVTAAGDAAVTLPKFLPTALRAMGGNIISSSVGYAVSVNTPTQSGFNIGVYTNATTRGAANVMWWAIGE